MLPSDIFQAPTLLSFAAVKNCFTGSIPSSICSATLLQTLALDGLHSAAGCTHKIYSSLSHSLFTTIISMSSYELSSAIDGSIPSCIYSLPNLHTMHLSGNGIRDTFPSFAVSRWSKDLPISASLTDLSLSHNSLRGEIPSAIQQHAWYNLDLSFNALSGTLEDGFLAPDLYNTSLGIQSTSSLSLVVNRLSGTIPKTIQNLLNIDILQGNIFSCSTGASIASDLPQNDEHVASYECGSDSVNTACYVFLACLCTTAILLATSYAIYVYISETTKPLRERLKKLLEQLEKYWYMFHPSQSHHGDQESSMVRFSNLNLQYRFFMLAITAYIMLILMPTYIGLASSYSTYSHKYAYAISLAYLSGTVPAGLLFSLIIILYALVKFPLLMLWESTKRVTRLEDSDYSSTGDSNSATVSQISSSVQSLSNTTDVPQSNILSDSQPSSNIFSANLHYSSLYWKWYAQWYMPVFFILLLNIMVVLVINMAYVYSSSVTFTTPTIPVFISFAMTAFKIGWNNQLTVKILPRELFRLKATILPQHPWVVQSNSRPVQQAIAKQMDQLIMLVLILLSIFNNVIAAYISSIFINPNCFYYTIYSLPAIEASYSYTYCKQFFVVPDISSCLQSETLTRQTAYNPPFIYNYQCSSSLLTTFINIYMYRYIFGGIVTPILQLAAKVLLDYLLSVTSSTPEKTYIGTVIVLLKKYVPPALQVPLPTSDQKSTGNDEVTLLSSNTVEFKKFFNRESYIVRIVGDIAVLLTFGAVFPPLALLIAVCSVLNTLYVQLLLGRLLHVVAELKEQHETTAQKTMDYLKEFPSFLSKELRNIDHDCALALPYFSVLMVAFFSFSLFDTLADSVGNAGAIWIVIFLMTLPIADYSLFFLYQNRKELYGRMMNWYSRYCCGASKVTNTAVTSVVEMSTNALHLNEEGNSNEQTDT